ncbi:Holliday junction resolvase RuvX [Methylococcus capsulatus]|uniref:Holliday junction resolvase RuvX n=1 Tax=Methylococcus capsulatus TaxID=414 RepID=UPI001C52C177|nr:Holliday junction resolvase RuvX [Methylococcus capsulatus]QXP87086.1 Holliday junction resolvase RuvX [Methylococcus capsulatus]QXP91567.1 Holliday junction resolvase RuvX [Methylococcus capsulatus]QXP93234.1 Holliday junction resolvase RuvX [Methylococcus capsulatus]UQN12071.1 Holliday junction resolvase RuvX [Methylococcus capsulatus]
MAEVLADSRGATYLGFDFGERNIGVAVGQSVTGTAAPLRTLRAQPSARLWAAISELIDQWLPAGLVVGLSHQQDGSENPITAPTLRFCRQLEGRYRLPVYTVDETLTTAESRTHFYQRRRRKSVEFEQVKDEMAAQLILQTWFSIDKASPR